jgi:glucokinase
MINHSILIFAVYDIANARDYVIKRKKGQEYEELSDVNGHYVSKTVKRHERVKILNSKGPIVEKRFPMTHQTHPEGGRHEDIENEGKIMQKIYWKIIGTWINYCAKEGH